MTARLWDARTGKSIGPPLRHDGIVSAVTFRSDGKSILTGSWDGTVRLWDLPPGLAEDVERLTVWVETLTGREMDEQGSVHDLNNDAWLERRERLEQLGGPP